MVTATSTDTKKTVTFQSESVSIPIELNFISKIDNHSIKSNNKTKLQTIDVLKTRIHNSRGKR